MTTSDRYIDLAALVGDCAAGGLVGGGAGLACSRTRVRGAGRLAEALGAARLSCFPTDTVYGLGGLCRPAVVQALQAAKGRDPDKPLQVVFPSLPSLLTMLDPPPPLAEALRSLLPGPVTVVVPYPEGFAGPPPGRGAGGTPTLGVRVPSWPASAVAMSWVGTPLVASSANPSGGVPARRLDEVDAEVTAACDLLLDGGELPGVASTVVDLSSYADDGGWRLLRAGAMGDAAVAAALAGEPAPEPAPAPQQTDRSTTGRP